MNERSSRSHTIVTMAIESRERDEEEGGGRDGPVKVSSIVSCKLRSCVFILHTYRGLLRALVKFPLCAESG